KGVRTICTEVSNEYEKETGKLVTLNYNTLLRHASGKKSLSKFNEEKGWLLPKEVDKLIQLTEEFSERAIPLTHKTLKEAAEHVLKARLGNDFTGLGTNW
ncbi:uncharacterized protein FOMMEDRAFT_67427, partial [Fomitiporia mediterranea MF3/22]